MLKLIRTSFSFPRPIYRASLKNGEVFVQHLWSFIDFKYLFLHVYLIPTCTIQSSISQDFTASWQMKNEHMAEILKSHHKDQHFMFLQNFLQFSKLYCSAKFEQLLPILSLRKLLKGWIVKMLSKMQWFKSRNIIFLNLDNISHPIVKTQKQTKKLNEDFVKHAVLTFLMNDF